MEGQAALASASRGSHLGASARARACLRTAARRRFPAQAVAAVQRPVGRRGGAGLCAGQQELKASVLTAAASLEAVRAALREPRRTLTELGDGAAKAVLSLNAEPKGRHSSSKVFRRTGQTGLTGGWATFPCPLGRAG